MITNNNFKRGPLNKISDVQGIKVGHCTIKDKNINTGVTIVSPSDDNVFMNKLEAATHVINGFGKSVGLMQIEELGQLESPIALTNTLNVGKVLDAVTEHMLLTTEFSIKSFNGLVCECNDSRINEIGLRSVGKDHVLKAFDDLKVDFQQGDIGAGTGTICHQLKGGIGSSSRLMMIDETEYTIGVLVQSNYGLLNDLVINGDFIGKKLKEDLPKENDEGSIVIILATDLPLDSRQLKRVAKRVTNGLSRVGCYSGHGSGEIVIAFSTSRSVNDLDSSFKSIKRLKESRMDIPFRAVIEATEEAVLNSMLYAKETKTLDGKKVYSLGDLLKSKPE